jgi:GSH-dependent disulfide-bond oxidoreductase
VTGGSKTREDPDMIRFYYNLSPNPMKVALCLEELGLDYEPVPVDTRKGEQFDAAYQAINPNAKVPSIVDGDATVFDSNAILLYLAEKAGRFLPPADGADGGGAAGEMLSWLMFVATGIGPFSGQCVHFRHFAPEDAGAYATERYVFEAQRHWNVLEERLTGRAFVLGDDYTIVDMAAWGWARMVPFVLGEDAFDRLPNVKRLLDTVNARPAAQRAEALKQRHAFKAEMDDEARRNMFRFIKATA